MTTDNKIKTTDEALLKLLRINEAWPLKDVLSQLISATDKLLIDKGYDGNTWEEMQACSQIAKELVSKIDSYHSILLSPIKNKYRPFTVAKVRSLEKQVLQGEISYSRMIEVFNEMAQKEYDALSSEITDGEIMKFADESCPYIKEADNSHFYHEGFEGGFKKAMCKTEAIKEENKSQHRKIEALTEINQNHLSEIKELKESMSKMKRNCSCGCDNDFI